MAASEEANPVVPIAQSFADALAHARCRNDRVGVAVSGGSDSMALLLLADNWARDMGCELRCVTVDHRLRESAADEARFVASRCRELGVPHETLEWKSKPDSGNLQDTARVARRQLIGNWARRHGIDQILLGHTGDDQAETFLIRLARGSGVDGLASMYEVERESGLSWIRPLLNMGRQDLREFLNLFGETWCEDPSNDDDRFHRIRIRKAKRQLEELGLGTATMVGTAERMKRARYALEFATEDLAVRAARPTPFGSVVIDLEPLGQAPEEIRLRLLAHALKWISGSRYRPRFLSLLNFMDAVMEGRLATLSGCISARTRDGRMEICREVAQMQRQPARCGTYDGRWEVTVPPGFRDAEIGPLGDEGLRQCPDWKSEDASMAAITATPSLWVANELISAPLAGMTQGCDCFLKNGVNSFFKTIVTH